MAPPSRTGVERTTRAQPEIHRAGKAVDWSAEEPYLSAIRERTAGNHRVGRRRQNLTPAVRAEAAYRYGKSYELVWWIRAEEPATLASDYRALAGALHLVRAEGPSGWAEGLQEWLRQRSHWLLEFDDAQGPAQVRPYLPAGAGHVTVTSRNPVWQGMGNVLTVPVLPRDEAAAFLLAEPGSLTR